MKKTELDQMIEFQFGYLKTGAQKDISEFFEQLEKNKKCWNGVCSTIAWAGQSAMTAEHILHLVEQIGSHLKKMIETDTEESVIMEYCITKAEDLTGAAYYHQSSDPVRQGENYAEYKAKFQVANELRIIRKFIIRQNQKEANQ